MLTRWRHRLEKEFGPAAARLQAVITTAAMDEAQRSAWCRGNGVYAAAVEGQRYGGTEWGAGERVTAQQGRDAKKRIKELERDLRGKDKALAGTTARCWWRQNNSRRSCTERKNDRAGKIATGRCSGWRWPACKVAGIDARSMQRWKAGGGLERGDGRPQALQPACAHALGVDERQRILELANKTKICRAAASADRVDAADEGTYIASESSFSRVLRAHGQVRHRGRSKAPQRSRPPSTHVATGCCNCGAEI